MRKINTVKELVDFAYNKYKTKKAITIESDYIKNINYFNFRFDIYSMARVIKSKENQIRNNRIFSNISRKHNGKQYCNINRQ